MIFYCGETIEKNKKIKNTQQKTRKNTNSEYLSKRHHTTPIVEKMAKKKRKRKFGG